MSKLFHQCQFLISAANLTQLPTDCGAEVAFVGRSNAGKSSALNAIAGIKKLAKVSNTPGRTQLINLFSVSDEKRLVDLPGYGFAKVPIAVKHRWQQTLADYLATRACLQGLVLLMDVRHPLKPLDLNFLKWSASANLPLHVLLTKADKLSRNASMQSLQGVLNALPQYHPEATAQLFSATSHLGLDQASQQVFNWLNFKK
jgi:GTP-binding protein